MSIHVRSLTGWTAHIPIGESDTGADLKRKIVALNPPFSKFKLLFKAVRITDDAALSRLALSPGDFLTVIPMQTAGGGGGPRAATSAAPRQRPPEPGLSPSRVLTTSQPVPYSSAGLITLLPGLAEDGADAAFELAVAQCVLPLPARLERLQRIFAALNTLYAFMLGRQVQMTWANSCAALRSRLPGDDVSLEDVELAAALVPDVLVLKKVRCSADGSGGGCGVGGNGGGGCGGGRGGGGGGGTTVDGGRGADSASGSTPDAAALAGGGSLHTLLAAQGWRPEMADRAPLLDKLAAAPAVQYNGGVLCGDDVFKVELLDPGSAAPLLYEVDRPHCTREAEPNDAGGNASENLPPPVLLEDGRKLRFARNVNTRRAWHPLFAASLVGDRPSLAQLRSAAAELRARRAALSSMRAAGGTAGGKGAGAGAGGWCTSLPPGSAPRPPTLLRCCEPCMSRAPLDAVGLLSHLQQLSWYQGQVAHVQVLPARPAATAVPAAPLAPPVLRALASLGIPGARLYTHQAAAVDAVLGYRHCRRRGPHRHPQQNPQQQQWEGERPGAAGVAAAVAGDGPWRGDCCGGMQDAAGSPGAGGCGCSSFCDGAVRRVPRRHVVVATSTASGKSLCYVVPLLQALAEDPDACALLMFPTKALAQDQLRATRELLRAAFGGEDGRGFVPAAEVYDGDTAQSDRPELRLRAQVLLTNPDMLHATVLPGHRSFDRLLSKLALVVVDEGHAYGGVFGAHTGLVLRRLRRLCAHVYGSDPRFVMTSATVANPGQLAATLIGIAPPRQAPPQQRRGPGAETGGGLGMSEAEDPEQAEESEEDDVALVVVGPECDGSPCAARHFVMWNPPLTDAAQAHREHLGRRQAAGAEARQRPMPPSGKDEEADAGNAGSTEALPAAATAGALAAPAAALHLGLLSRTEARTRGHVSRNALRAAQRRMMVEARTARARGPQLAAERLAGGPDAAAAAAEIVQVAAVARALPQLREALFGSSPERRRAAERRLQGMSAAGAGAAAATATTAMVTKLEDVASGAPDTAGGSSDCAPVQIPGRGRIAAAMAAAPRQVPGIKAEEPDEVPHAEDATAVAAQVRAALSAASADLPGTCRSLPSLAGPIGASAPLRTRPVINRSGGSLATAAKALGLPPPPGSAAAGSSAADPRVVSELLARLPTPEQWKEQHGAAGTPLEARRESPIVETALLLAECVQHGLRCLAFCRSRKLCELVAAYTRETLAACAPECVEQVKVYRAGYSPAERRALEADLHSGRLRALAATNALELGVDVGGLDVTIHLGFPGSVASLRQQAGRAGRRERASVSLLVAFDGPLDQHWVRHPDELLGRSVESVQVDVSNMEVLQQHLLCAATEHPLLLGQDGPMFGPRLREAVLRLMAARLLARRPGGPLPLPSDTDAVAGQVSDWRRAMSAGAPYGDGSLLPSLATAVGAVNAAAVQHEGDPGSLAGFLDVPLVYCGPRDNPASAVTLRAIDPDRFVVWDESRRMPLEEIEADKAFYQVYDGAVYMFQGRPYLCRQLNLGERVALVRPVDVKYYTKLKDYTEVHVTGCHVAYPGPATDAHMGQATSVHKESAPEGTVASMATAAADPSARLATTPVEDLGGAGRGGSGSSSDGGAVCEPAVVAVRYLGYHRVWHGSNRVFDSVDLFLPDVVFDTQATYVRIPASARRECDSRGLPFREGVHAANHALLNVVPVYLSANSNDLGTECDNPYDTRYRIERLLMYDRHRGGGVGLAAAAAPRFRQLLRAAYRRVTECPCPYAAGCPQAYTWLQRLAIEETATKFDRERSEIQQFAFKELPGASVAEIKLEQPGPRMLLSAVSTAESPVLRWQLLLRGNNAAEFGVIPVDMQDQPKALHKCQTNKMDERATGFSSAITVGSLLPARLPIMKGTVVEVLVTPREISFIITNPEDGSEMIWQNNSTVSRPYKGPRELRLQLPFTYTTPVKLAVTAWQRAAFDVLHTLTPEQRETHLRQVKPVVPPSRGSAS
ncbi:hypothetical protein GPECTOR_1g880 [Gonium pectorale]|uniref:Uncharacterized protein n=1 Tax=Gonium pectorale TaxID=33097 RepID=A0A150H4M8_GONPE|nr:hypothetical protein GPECTOR_1g880 [Gonium pectorale]|eukprot:KXZ56975.1 hypothetical protein GPECTOR_1g880 [Gonium pectorale]